MIAAALAGIKVFATGGIGGVHKGAEKSFDISADLDELARTPVIVVSAGAKAILDIEKTLEVLETRGVPVVAYRSDEMPAFWSRHSRFRRRSGSTSRRTIARFFKTRRALGLDGGMLVANPVEAEATRFPPRRWPVISPPRRTAAERAAGDRQGGDAVPARRRSWN